MQLDTFTRQYLETALWSTTDDDDEPLDGLYGIDDFDDETLADAIADCAAFQADNAADINGRDSRAGHDFWLTRNHHGAGFWDGDWPNDAGHRMTLASHAYGSVDLYVCDGKVYG